MTTFWCKEQPKLRTSKGQGRGNRVPIGGPIDAPQLQLVVQSGFSQEKQAIVKGRSGQLLCRHYIGTIVEVHEGGEFAICECRFAI
jgi:hypothetical protein